MNSAEVEVRLNTNKGKYHLLFKGNDELNDKLPKTIIKSLGSPAEEIVETNGEEIARRQERIAELREQQATTSNENQRENLNQTIAEEMDAIAQVERANEEIEQRMTLRDRAKAIFKKYGFTVLAVAYDVGVVIGVIVANLKNGLTSLGKGVGNGLKIIGKKLGEILPGLVGAIASFVFRTAGEVIGFLAKNAWLLIVGALFILSNNLKRKSKFFKMTYITTKTKETNANIKIFPPIVLNERSHISLVDIKIPEEVTKNFTFTNRQVISTESNNGVPKMIVFPKGVYNINKIQYKINTSPLAENIDLNIETINNNNINIVTKSNTIKFSPELAKTLGIPETLPPFSSVKISSDKKYLINCNFVETNSSYSFKATPGTVYPSRFYLQSHRREMGVTQNYQFSLVKI